MCNFDRGHYEQYFCERPVVQEMLFKIFHLQLWWHFCLAEQNQWCNFGKGYYEEHYDQQSCEIILNLEEMWVKEKVNGQTLR